MLNYATIQIIKTEATLVTLQTLLIGFVTLIAMALLGRLIKGSTGLALAIKAFFPVWFIYCAYHMSVGMSHGYSFMSELPFFLINFGIPAAAAFSALRKMA